MSARVEPQEQAAPAPLLEVRDLARSFRLPREGILLRRPLVRALDGVSLAVPKGAAFAVVGESGCGKTTLGRVVMGLLAPSRGEVLVDGRRIDRLSARSRRRYRARMQMIFQNPYASLNPRRTVAETLSEPVRALLPGVRGAELRARVQAVMAATGCEPSWAPRLPHEFSGGQRQRIAIARALVTEPDLVVADEPVSALDVSIQAQILNLMMDLREAQGLTYLFITHDLSVVRQFATHVAVMYAGRVMETGPAPALFAAPQHPYTRLLLASVPKLAGGSFGPDRPPAPPPSLGPPERGCPFAPRCDRADETCRRERPALRPLGGVEVACHHAEAGEDGGPPDAR